jgi:hypothetical protein
MGEEKPSFCRYEATKYFNNDLDPLEPTKFHRRDPRFLIVGQCESGKTTILKKILKDINPLIKSISAFTQSEIANPQWTNIIPSNCIKSRPFTQQDAKILEKEQADFLKKHDGDQTKHALHVLIIDDFVDRSLTDREWFKSFIKTCRHYKIVPFCLCHRLTDMSPHCIDNFTNYILCGPFAPKVLSPLYDSWVFDCFKTKHDFYDFMNQACEEKGRGVVISKGVPKQEKITFIFPKKEEIKNLVLGPAEFWFICLILLKSKENQENEKNQKENHSPGGSYEKTGKREQVVVGNIRFIE